MNRSYSRRLMKVFTTTLITISSISTASAITVEIEFLGDSFFSQDAQAVAAINAAAQHVGDAITSTLAPIDQVNFTNTVGNTTATLDWSFQFLDRFTNEPVGDFPVNVSNPNLASDVVRVFIDAQPLDGNSVGLGVPAGARADLGASILGPGPLNTNAIQSVVGLADTEMNRGGGGALIDTLFDGGETIEGEDIDSIRFRTSFGGVAFDNDTDDNDQPDTAQQLEEFWHLDHTTTVDPGEIDLFSVAVSEIVTALGFGTSASFEAQASGTNWAGAEVIALLGTGDSVLDPSSPNNILSGTLSTRISDGAVQEVALDADIQPGERHELTALDLAFLRDIGFETIAAANPTSADFNNDGDIDGVDFLVWQQGGSPNPLSADDLALWQAAFGNPSASVSAVPEPCSTLLLVSSLIACDCLRRTRNLTI